MRVCRWTILLGVLAVTLNGAALAGLPADKVPDFKVRFRLKGEQAPPKGYQVALGGTKKSVTAAEGKWSDWIEVGRDEVKAALGAYPNSYSRTWPVRFGFSVRPVKGTVHVEVEGQIEGKKDEGTADLTGGQLGLAVWRDDKRAYVATLGTYNRRQYWSAVDRVKAKGRLPEKILLADRFIPGDSDRTALVEGYAGLRKLGMNVLMVEPAKGRRLWSESSFSPEARSPLATSLERESDRAGRAPASAPPRHPALGARRRSGSRCRPR